MIYSSNQFTHNFFGVPASLFVVHRFQSIQQPQSVPLAQLYIKFAQIQL